MSKEIDNFFGKIVNNGSVIDKNGSVIVDFVEENAKNESKTDENGGEILKNGSVIDKNESEIGPLPVNETAEGSEISDRPT